MQRNLAIIRHAKSTWEYGAISDFDRPLKESGIRHAIVVAQKLQEKGIRPSLIITSPANRALHTAMIFARELHYPAEEVRINPALYNETEEEIVALLKSLDDAYETVFIFGHNPTFTYLSNLFLKQELGNIPTAGIVFLTFTIDSWEAISKKTVDSELFIFPKKLNS